MHKENIEWILVAQLDRVVQNYCTFCETYQETVPNCGGVLNASKKARYRRPGSPIAIEIRADSPLFTV